MKQRLTRSVTLPMVLFGTVLALVVVLATLWNYVLVQDYVRLREVASGISFHWGFVATGAAIVLAIVVLLGVLASQLASEIRWNVRTSNFIASVTHELNSPLSSIKLYAQTLRGTATGEEDRARFLEIMLADVERLSRMVQNVLRAAQLDQGRLPLHREHVELGPLLGAYAEEVSHGLARRGRGDVIRVESRDEPAVEIDRAAFRQVLDNLVDNATKYCKGGRAQVTLETKAENGTAQVLVRDDGIGIPESERELIFERFYRIEDPRRNRKGTGLGLWIVRSIVEAHGGSITCESEGEGRGATFRIELPLAAREPVSPGEPS